MKKYSKTDLVADIMNLNQIIDHINEANCYEEVVKFYQITSHIQDCAEEVLKFLPVVKGFKFCGCKSNHRKESEARRELAEAGLKVFISKINSVGRDGHGSVFHRGRNRTEPGEKVCADKLYFGSMQTEYTSLLGSISITKAKDCKDEDTQKIMRKTITDFVKSQGKFETNWLTNR